MSDEYPAIMTVYELVFNLKDKSRDWSNEVHKFYVASSLHSVEEQAKLECNDDDNHTRTIKSISEVGEIRAKSRETLTAIVQGTGSTILEKGKKHQRSVTHFPAEILS